MNFEMFFEEVKNELVKYLSKDSKDILIERSSYTKVNDLHITQLCIWFGKFCFAYNMDKAYENYRKGCSLENILESIKQAIQESTEDVDAISSLRLSDWSAQKDKIMPRLVKKAWNETCLEDRPHRELCDLAIITVIKLDLKFGCVSVAVTSSLLKMWGIAEEELFNTAMRNLKKSDYRIISMKEIVKERLAEVAREMSKDTSIPVDICETMLGLDVCDESELYVLTNEDCLYGSSVLLHEEALKKVVERFGDVVFLPSSVHEWIIMAVDKNKITDEMKKWLREMVMEVTHTAVEKDQLLSETPYLLDKETLTLKPLYCEGEETA